MKIAFYGSSLLSSWWNGAATYYRGLLESLAALGYDIHFYEPDAFDRQKHRDMEAPEWACVHVYEASDSGLRHALAHAADADIVVKASGVGVFDEDLLTGLLEKARPDALKIFWDVDAPATLATLHADATRPLRQNLDKLDAVLTYGGGDPVVSAYRALGARFCEPVYNALSPATHFPVASDPRFACDLAFLGNRLPDREARVEEFFLKPAARLPGKKFLIAGNGWADKHMPTNIVKCGHIYTHDHNALNASALAVLNIARDSMADTGFSPATRVFEAAGAGACIITDAWRGIEEFLEPHKEIIVARDGQDVAEALRTLTPEKAAQIGAQARQKILAHHTYEKRAAQVHAIFRQLAEERAPA